MKKCHDNKFSNMIYAYELDILPEQDRQDFEMHLMECDSCSEELRQFRREALLLRKDPDIKRSVENTLAADKSLDERHSEWSQKQKSKIIWKSLIPVTLAVAVFLILILVDWDIEIKPFKEAEASENRLVILFFTNISEPSDPGHLAEIATNLLTTSLGESKYLQVTSNERLLSIIHSLGIDKKQSSQVDWVFDIAREANAKWILSGEILNTTPNLLVTTQIVEVATGDVIAAQRIKGDVDEDIFSVVDKICEKISRDLHLPHKELENSFKPVAEITTHSREAYLHFLEGVEYKTRFYLDKAIEQFELALEHDSTMAMAYFYLALLKDRELITKALKFSENASQREKYHINTTQALLSGDIDKAIEIQLRLIDGYPDDIYAYWRLGQIHLQKGEYEKAISFYKQAIELDPLNRDAYNSMAYAYDAMGDLEKSLLAINDYINIAPGEANPYDTRGDLYANHGQHEKAIASYSKALSIKSDYFISLEKLGQQYLFNHEYEMADSCFRVLASLDNRITRLHNQFMIAASYLYRGYFTGALAYLDSIIARYEEQGDYTSVAAHLSQKAGIYVELKYLDKAIELSQKCRELVSSEDTSMVLSYQTGHIFILAASGKIENALVELKDLKSSLEQNSMPMVDYFYAKGFVEFYSGNYSLSIQAFQELQKLSKPDFLSNYMIARASLKSQQLGQAAEKFVQLLSYFGSDRLKQPLRNVKIHYFLGLTYEESHWNNKAIEQYQIFISLWKDIDTELEEVADAKNRLHRLRQLMY